MRTTVTIDDDLLEQAQEYTGIKEKSALLRSVEIPDGARGRLAAGACWRKPA